MKYVIVGGGIAACSALKAIRDYDSEGTVTVISDEKQVFYYRPAIPLVVKGEKERGDILYDEHLPEHRVILDRAVSLDPDNRQITLEKGDLVPFDRLLIATGSSPVIPDLPGIEEKNVHFLRTLADAQGLKKSAKGAKKAVVIGGGLVGIKKAVALNVSGLSVTVVEQLDHILLPRLDREGSEIVTGILRDKEIRIITNATVTRIGKNGKSVTISTGETLETDLVCVAVGIRPNIDWLSGSGLAINKALIVDEKMQANVEGIYGAGDVVETTDTVTGKSIVSGLWTNAVEMGKTAGINMGGGKRKYPGSLEVMNATEIERLAMISVGDILAEGDGSESFASRHGNLYRKTVFQGDRLTGAVFVGDINRAGLYTAMIRSGVPVGPLKEQIVNGTLTYIEYAHTHH